MNTKAVAAVVAGIIILSVVFFQFNVTYPTGPLKINPPPVTGHNVTKIKLGYLFSPQYAEPPEVQNLSFGTGISSTNNFTFIKNGTTVIEGQLTNATSGNIINRTHLFVLASPVYTETTVGPDGTYAVNVLVYGQMNLTFVVPGYQKKIVPVNLGGGAVHVNLAFQPEHKIQWTGSTVSSTGTLLPNVTVNSNAFFDGPQMFFSNKLASFSVHLYEDYYPLSVNYADYNSIPAPRSVSLSAPLHQNLTLTKKTYAFNLTGHVYNKVTDKPIAMAKVLDQQTNMYSMTNAQGFYMVGAVNGINRLITSHSGYFTNVSYYNGSQSNFSLPVHDIYLEPLNPFLTNSTGFYGNSSKYPSLTNNSSVPDLNQTGSYLLTGQITVNGTSIPIANTSFTFLVNVNGSVYGDSVKTNASGHYFAYFYCAGQYSILVQSVLYESKVISVSISRSTTYDNFSLIPYGNRSIYVTGYVKNRLDQVPIGGASISAVYVKNHLVASSVSTNRNGYFSMVLISGKFTFSVSKYGFITNTTGVIGIDSNISMIFNLTPQKSLPVGSNPSLHAAGKSPSYGLPDLPPSQIYSSLTNSGTIYSTAVYNLTLHFNDSFMQSISNTSFVVYVKVNDQLYYYLGTTDSAGFSYLPGMNAGLYDILPETFYYRGTVQTINVSGNATLWFTLTKNYVFGSTMYLQNTFNLSHSLSGNVPGGPLDLTNSILSMSIVHADLANSTMFNFSGYNGTFNFTYLNEHFVQNSFSVIIAGHTAYRTVGLNPFEIVLNGNTTASWEYHISGTTYNYNSPGGLSVYYNLERLGHFNLTVGLNGFQVYKYMSITLTDSTPVKEVYFNQTSGSAGLYWKGGEPYGSNVRMLYSGTLPSDVFVYAGLLPYSAPNNISVYMNGTLQGAQIIQESGQTAFTLNSYYLASGSLNVAIDIPPNISGGFNGGTGNLEIYYYQISLT